MCTTEGQNWLAAFAAILHAISNMLYHYTSQVGIVGICSSKTLWASKIQYLNDHQEFKIGIDLAKEALFEAGESVDTLLKRICRDAIERIDRVQTANIFVASFSESGDLLSQWRAYSKGSVGFAVGFTPETLSGLDPSGFRLRKCIYDPTEQKQVFREAISQCLAARQKAVFSPAYDYEAHLDAVGMSVIGEVVTRAPLMKHHGFSEEREWRLVSYLKSYGGGRCKARPGAAGLIPYYEIPLGASPKLVFDEIRVGPSHDPNQAIDGLGALLASQECAAKSIKPSRIPFRNT